MGDWLFAQEPELLEATLSLLESLDSSSDDKSDASYETVAEKVTQEEPRPKRINVFRERLRQELQELRSTSVQLEAQLTTLQLRRESQLRPHLSGGAVLSVAPIWENLARRQFQARKQSEAINVKLRAKLDVQAQAARELFDAIELAVRRHREVESTETRRVRLPIDVSQRMSEEDQLLRLHANHAKWQWALSLSPKIQRGELQFTDIHVAESDGYAATLELHYSHPLPYAVDAVAKLMWSILLDESGVEEEDQGVSYAHDHRSLNDVIIAVFSSQTTMGGQVESGGKMHGKWVAKRERLEGGTQHLITTQWQYELAEFENELNDVSVEEDLWVRLVDAREIGHSHLTEPLTVLQQVRRMRLHLSRIEPADKEYVERVTSMFTKQIEIELDWMARHLENMLMTPFMK